MGGQGVTHDSAFIYTILKADCKVWDAESGMHDDIIKIEV